MSNAPNDNLSQEAPQWMRDMFEELKDVFEGLFPVLAPFRQEWPLLNSRVARFPLAVLGCERFCSDSAAFNRHHRRIVHTAKGATT
jgi:hypothetical protein